MVAILLLVMFSTIFFGLIVFLGAPYVPSKKRDIRQAFTELYQLGEKDVLIDIGSGDGVVLREAAKLGARAIGIELNPLLVFLSRILSRYEHRVHVKMANFWHVTFPDETTVVYVFGDSRDIDKMADKVREEATRLGKSLALISYGFAVPRQKPVKEKGAYYLYEYHPLQPKKA